MASCSVKLACLALALVATTAMVTPCAAQNTAQDYLDLHNEARADVGVEPLSWDASLAAYAKSYAATRRADCQLEVSNGPYGENLFWGSAGGDWSAADVVGSWVAQKKNYNHHSNSCAAGKRCGSYTQVVWRRSSYVGCAGVVCSNKGGVFVICSYNPPGNVVGQSPY